MLQLTRVYKDKKSGQVKSQKYMVRPEAVMSVRPSNALGKANHRSTITLVSGQEITLAEKFSEVKTQLTPVGYTLDFSSNGSEIDDDDDDEGASAFFDLIRDLLDDAQFNGSRRR